VPRRIQLLCCVSLCKRRHQIENVFGKSKDCHSIGPRHDRLCPCLLLFHPYRLFFPLLLQFIRTVPRSNFDGLTLASRSA
jgi:hypothetical protein